MEPTDVTPTLRQRAADVLPGLGLTVAALGMCTSVPLCYAGYGLAALGVLADLRRVAPFLVGWPWAVALVVWMAVTGWLSPYPDAKAMPPGWAWCWPAVAVWAVAVASGAWLRRAALALTAGAALAFLLTCVQFVVGYDQLAKPWRVRAGGEQHVHGSGFYSHWIRHGVAQACVTAWGIAWVLTRPGRPLLRWLAAGALLGLGGASVLLSGARSALLGLAAGVWGRRRRARLAFGAGGHCDGHPAVELPRDLIPQRGSPAFRKHPRRPRRPHLHLADRRGDHQGAPADRCRRGRLQRRRHRCGGAWPGAAQSA